MGVVHGYVHVCQSILYLKQKAHAPFESEYVQYKTALHVTCEKMVSILLYG